MERVLVLLYLFGPPLLLVLSYRTRLWWLAGAALIAVGLCMFVGVQPTENDESDPGLSAIGNAILVAGGILSALYGFACLAIARRWHDRHIEHVENLPPATVVAGVTER